MPARDEELERARHMFLRVFGPHYGAALCRQLAGGEFATVLMCRIAPEVWGFAAPELRTKILIALGVCAAAHQDVRYFVRAAIHHGISRAEVEGTLLLAGLEGGFPAAGAAHRAVQQAFEEHLAMLRELGEPPVDW